MAPAAPYKDRRTWLIEVADIANLKMKIYGMVGAGKEIQSPSVKAAKSFIEASVDFGSKPKFGFIVIHHGEEALWLLVDWWIEDILHQSLFFAPIDDIENFQKPGNHEMACVWELLVTSHERDAWVKHTMMDPANADFEAWLSDVLAIK